MAQEKRFLIDVGMQSLPFPIRAISRVDEGGQHTITKIDISARIMREFEAHWIDKFIQIAHHHRKRIGTATLKQNILRYLKELQASVVQVDFTYPFFCEKVTPVTKEPGLVCYDCSYSAKVSSIDEKPKVRQSIEIPIITSYPMSKKELEGGLFGQLSKVRIEIEPKDDVFPEDLVDIADKHALAPVYSYLHEEDQLAIIQKIHQEMKTSVEVVDDIKKDLAADSHVNWYSVTCQNFGMLHNYHTIIGTEKSMWVPLSGENDEEI